MSQENLITWLIMLASLICITVWAGMSFEFQRRCEEACAPSLAMTPFIRAQEVCLCDEGHGRWRRTAVDPQ